MVVWRDWQRYAFCDTLLMFWKGTDEDWEGESRESISLGWTII